MFLLSSLSRHLKGPNVVVTETSYQRLEVLRHCNTSLYNSSGKKTYNEPFRGVYTLWDYAKKNLVKSIGTRKQDKGENKTDV